MSSKQARLAALLAAAVLIPCCAGDDVGSGDQYSIHTVRVSVAAFGEEIAGQSRSPSLSAEGRYVAFVSDAVNLTDGDTNGFTDVFVKDRQTGQVENLTNVETIGTEMNDCESPSISADGRFVAFVSLGNYTSSALIPSGYANLQKNIFVFDRQQRIFRTPWAAPFPDDESGFPSLSADGRYLAFTTQATNLGFTNAADRNQVCVCDFGPTYAAATITLASHVAATTGGNDHSVFGRIAADASYIVFMSNATDLVGADTHSGLDVYLWDRVGGAVTLASVMNPSDAMTINFWPSISADGRTVSYTHRFSGIILQSDLRIFDRQNGTTQSVSDTLVFLPNFDPSAISGDGQSAIYVGDAPGATTSQIYFWSAATGNQVISVSSGGDVGNRNSFGVAFSGDGRWAAFESLSSNLVAGDTNGALDVFVRGPLR